MSELDKIDLLRTLVINENLPGFDYTAHRFSFKTVFKRESYTYRCCNCAFEHEYMLYVSDKGEIIKEIFYRVVQNISLGECSHVKDVSEEFVTETSVGAIHIAVARGNKAAAEGHLDYSLKYVESANLYVGDPISKTRNTAPIRTNISDHRFLQRMCMPHPRFQSPRLRMNHPQPTHRMLLSDRNANNNAQTTVDLDDRQRQEDSHDFQKEILELTSQLLSHYDELKTEIVEALRRIPFTKRETDRNLNNYLTLPKMRNDFFKTVISLGGNVNFLSAFGKPAIDSMLKVKPINDVIMVREKVAIMIYENPDLNLHNKSVCRALKRDANFQGRAFISSFRENKLSCTYKTDAKTHGILVMMPNQTSP